MLLAAAGETTTTFNGFDIFMILFTVIILIGVVRLFKERPKKNLFAIAFGIISLLVFLVSDAIMIKGWFG
ncbi:hypothetical protein HMSSN036_75680 [Paenibacillus macerans]|uniref:DUF2759 family protein n=2 Tax=Paenibacillus TaxID=44249 RepID=A0A3P3TVQ7_9BACL|nr:MULTISPECIES: hypothetical protein [Paenibacillus]KFN07792.1 putative membrane protein [Paenibacillus macerans]MBS5913457.1 hypothetical protein [Paenibacillus macerans]MCY7557325.1 hypothetical protein [Paenibacillus macerans]MDU7476630.1 hypothetical protein [Paenibacillus macerans]MEC0140222.1 hypothetical protein [Paenibacillus macerans]